MGDWCTARRSNLIAGEIERQGGQWRGLAVGDYCGLAAIVARERRERETRRAVGGLAVGGLAMGDRWPATAFAGDRSPPRSGAYSQYTHTHTHTHTHSVTVTHTHTHTHTHAHAHKALGAGGGGGVYSGGLSAGNNSFRGDRRRDMQLA